MTDFPRLIENAFPLKQASLDSVHEKNVRHGHISTLHIWPARRPLAACRAALIATLLPDPGTPEKRRELCEKIGGRIVRKTERKKMPNGRVVERVKEETEGGILHWGRETENAETLEWFREEIRKAYGGRAPKVLDPFAGGGAIPLEAMRLGCEATAVDINPVAWFILKCTLEYPQKLAGQTRPLPEFILHNDAFMEDFFKKAKGYTKAEVRTAMKRLHKQLKAKRKSKGQEQESLPFAGETDELEADLAWHVRAWGQWVLDHARRELAEYYPTYADFEPLKPGQKSYERQPMMLVPVKEDGTPDIESLNADFTDEYLEDKRNPRWVAKPTVAYLWARTVKCKNCRATVPLLKTRWLSKKANERVLLTMQANSKRTAVDFGIEIGVPAKGGNAAQRREHDKRIGSGTMSRAGVKCPCCGAIMTMQDVRIEGQMHRLGSVMTAVVVSGPKKKEYRLPTEKETQCAQSTDSAVPGRFRQMPFGELTESTPSGGGRGAGRAFSVQGYGMMEWRHLYTGRQMFALGSVLYCSRAARAEMTDYSLPPDWLEAISSYLAIAIDRLADRCATLCTWDQSYTKINHVFHRYALPITWDFCEGNPLSDTTGNYGSCVEWSCRYLDHALVATVNAPNPQIMRHSAIKAMAAKSADVVVTDPPYYDAIPYSDLMDFFYVWLRRNVPGLTEELDAAFCDPLSPKWDHEQNDGELIDDDSRHGGDSGASKRAYEEGMARAFEACQSALMEDGRLVIVFAHKQPDAWETLVAAIIRSGFTVDASWPIQTEMSTGLRNVGRASLASSVWLVCKKRRAIAQPGWDNKVLDDMRVRIAEMLREFWDAGIRGPDFVWAATGPAMEAYSKHPVVKKANAPGEIMGVHEFLTHVRRMVVDYVVGQVLTGLESTASESTAISTAEQLDSVTAYYLLHRHDFGMDEAPVGACILYATACSLSDSALVSTWDILSKGGGSSSASSSADDDDSDGEDADADDDASSGGKVKLKTWAQRKGKSLGYEAPGGKVPLIDRVHRLMHLWKAGDVHKVDDYLSEHALGRNELFKRVVQSLIELSENTERSLLESISNHIGIRAAERDRGPELFAQSAVAGGDAE